MVRNSIAILLGCYFVILTGCTLCPSPHADEYGAYGGIWQRDDLNNGRVGSVFAPAGHRIEDPQQVDAPTLAPADGEMELPPQIPENTPDDSTQPRDDSPAI